MLDPLAQAIQNLVRDYSSRSFDEFEKAAREVVANLAAQKHSPGLRLEAERRVAELLVTQAFGDNVSEKKMLALMREIDELGYSTAERRVHVACIFARWAARHPVYKLHARALLKDARHRILALPRASATRRQCLYSLDGCVTALGLNEKRR